MDDIGRTTGRVFRNDDDQVEYWIASFDTWIASTSAGSLMTPEQARRERLDRVDTETKHAERIQRLNDRFNDL